MSKLGVIALFGICGGGGAITGLLCGLLIANAAADAFGDALRFYHFVLMLACTGAGIAAGMVIAHSYRLTQEFSSIGKILGGAAWGFASASAGWAVAQSLCADALSAAFATVSWTVMGALLGATVTLQLEQGRPVSAAVGGGGAGLVAGCFLFDPFASMTEIIVEVAAAGFLIPATTLFFEGFFGELGTTVKRQRSARINGRQTGEGI